MTFLLDTNVVSELRKGKRANAGVLNFYDSTPDEKIFLPAQVIGEIQRGIWNIRGRNDTNQAEKLAQWLDTVTQMYSQRIIAFDSICALVWGRLMSPNPQNPVDKQIAAIALTYDMTLVTRNTRDVAETGARVLNPFEPTS